MQNLLTLGSRKNLLPPLSLLPVIFILDVWSKQTALTFLPLHQFVEVTPFFGWLFVMNHGVAFGLLAENSFFRVIVLVSIAISISVYLFWLLLRRKTPQGERYCYALILAGALGNIFDRFRFGGVIDFIAFHYENWFFPSFNIADIAISCGVALYVLQVLLLPYIQKYREK